MNAHTVSAYKQTELFLFERHLRSHLLLFIIICMIILFLLLFLKKIKKVKKCNSKETDQ